MVGILDEGFTNQINYYLKTQHVIFRAHIQEMTKIDNQGCLNANSKLTLHVANYQRSIKVKSRFLSAKQKSIFYNIKLENC